MAKLVPDRASARARASQEFVESIWEKRKKKMEEKRPIEAYKFCVLCLRRIDKRWRKWLSKSALSRCNRRRCTIKSGQLFIINCQVALIAPAIVSFECVLCAYFLTFRLTCIESLRSKWHINNSTTIHAIHSSFAAISLSTTKTLIQIDSRLKCEARVQKFSESKYLPFRIWRAEERHADPATATNCKHKIANRQQSLTSISANIVNVHTI